MNLFCKTFVVGEGVSRSAAVLGWNGSIVIKQISRPRFFAVRNMMRIFSGANFSFLLLAKLWTCLISCNICDWDFHVSRIKLMYSSADLWRIKSGKKRDVCSVEMFGRPLRPQSPLVKAKISSPEENPVSLKVSSSNIACDYAYTKTNCRFQFYICPGKLSF